jgi:CheY-like chemotaxis protein
VIGEDIELRTSLAPDLGKIRADLGQIEQVLLNLVVNARDAMLEGGVLRIETANVFLDEAYAVDHLDVAPGAYVMLAVTDAGMGMDKETVARIFEPFFTTKEKGKGTGLGLSIVFGIVKQSEGHVSVYSEPSLGTTFKIYLPRSEATAERRPLPALPLTRSRGSETILLVEDEDQVRAAAAEILRKSGHRVLEARSPREAIRIAEEHPATIDLLLSDLVMPEMNGRQVARRVGVARPQARVVFMSGYTGDVAMTQGVLDAGAFFLQKPFTASSLIRKVREALDTEANP